MKKIALTVALVMLYGTCFANPAINDKAINDKEINLLKDIFGSEEITIKNHLYNLARKYNLTDEDSKLFAAIYLAMIATKDPLLFKASEVSFLSYFKMVRWMYDTKRPLYQKGTDKILSHAQDYEFIDYFFAYGKSLYTNVHELTPEVYKAFLD